MADDKNPRCLQCEVRANLAALLVSIVFFIVSLGVGMAIDSVTLLLTSSAWLINVVTALIYHRIILTLDRKPDTRYHYGYAKYEPLVATVEGILTLSACVMAVKYAIQDMIHPEEVHSYALGLTVAAVTGLSSFVVGRYLSSTGRRLGSALLKASGLGWYTDGLLSLGVCLGFIAGYLLKSSGHAQGAALSDPVMSILLAGLLLIEPLKLVRESVGELLDVNPGADIEKAAARAVEVYRAKYGLPEIKRVRLRKAGRQIFVDVCFSAAPDETLAQADAIAQELSRHVREEFKHVDLTVSFSVQRASSTKGES